MMDIMSLLALLQQQQQQKDRMSRRSGSRTPASRIIKGNAGGRMSGLQQSQHRNQLMPKNPSMMPGISRRFVSEGGGLGVPTPGIPVAGGGLPAGVGPAFPGGTTAEQDDLKRKPSKKKNQNDILEMLLPLLELAKTPMGQAGAAGGAANLAGGNPMMAMMGMLPAIMAMQRGKS